VLFKLNAEKITNRCPPALPELATRLPSPITAYTPNVGTRLPTPETALSLCAGISGTGGQVAGRLREPFTTSLPGVLKEGEENRHGFDLYNYETSFVRLCALV
jgi:hypothetical protein